MFRSVIAAQRRRNPSCLVPDAPSWVLSKKMMILSTLLPSHSTQVSPDAAHLIPFASPLLFREKSRRSNAWTMVMSFNHAFVLHLPFQGQAASVTTFVFLL